VPREEEHTQIGKVKSKIGLTKEALTFDRDTKIREIIQSYEKKLYCVLIDEGHFLTQAQVLDLTQIVDYMDIPVIVYGLKNDFRNELFEGSKALLLYADKIEEIKTICWFCNKKATMVLRIIDGKAVYVGEQIYTGGDENYIPVCRKCYGNPNLERDKDDDLY